MRYCYVCKKTKKDKDECEQCKQQICDDCWSFYYVDDSIESEIVCITCQKILSENDIKIVEDIE